MDSIKEPNYSFLALLQNLRKAQIEQNHDRITAIVDRLKKQVKLSKTLFTTDYFTALQFECLEDWSMLDIFIVRNTNNKIEKYLYFKYLNFDVQSVKKIVSDMEVQENALSHCKN